MKCFFNELFLISFNLNLLSVSNFWVKFRIVVLQFGICDSSLRLGVATRHCDSAFRRVATRRCDSAFRCVATRRCDSALRLGVSSCCNSVLQFVFLGRCKSAMISGVEFLLSSFRNDQINILLIYLVLISSIMAYFFNTQPLIGKKL